MEKGWVQRKADKIRKLDIGLILGFLPPETGGEKLDKRSMNGSRAPKSQNFRTGVFPLNMGRVHVRARGCSPRMKRDPQGLNQRCWAAWG